MSTSRVVGLIPAAGKGTRVSPLPGSKELFPIGFAETVVSGQTRKYPKVVSQYLVEAMVRAGAERVCFIIGEEKWDIPRYYVDGRRFGLSIAYLLMDRLWGMPYTLNQAVPWLTDEMILFGMPDTIFTPPDVFVRLLRFQRARHNDVTLALFPTDQPSRFGMVQFGAEGRVTRVIDKPKQTDLTYMWGAACWSPLFTRFMSQVLAEPPKEEKEVVLGDIFQSAIDSGLDVRCVCIDDGEYVDIGTPNDLAIAVEKFSSRSSS